MGTGMALPPIPLCQTGRVAGTLIDQLLATHQNGWFDGTYLWRVLAANKDEAFHLNQRS
jgi:hypothetical protein